MPLSDEDQKRLERYIGSRYGAVGYEVLGSAAMLWCGWEMDTAAVLVKLSDGRLAWVILDSADVRPAHADEALRERPEVYERAIDDTRRLLAIARLHAIA